MRDSGAFTWGGFNSARPLAGQLPKPAAAPSGRLGSRRSAAAPVSPFPTRFPQSFEVQQRSLSASSPFTLQQPTVPAAHHPPVAQAPCRCSALVTPHRTSPAARRPSRSLACAPPPPASQRLRSYLARRFLLVHGSARSLPSRAERRSRLASPTITCRNQQHAVPAAPKAPVA